MMIQEYMDRYIIDMDFKMVDLNDCEAQHTIWQMNEIMKNMAYEMITWKKT